MDWTKGDYSIDDDPRKLDIETICTLLAASYWAAERPRETIIQSIAGSLCLGLYYRSRQIGFARWITDGATFAYLCDVIVVPEFRGQGLGKWLVESAVNHPGVQSLTQLLSTRDAHGLYERYGFARSESMRRKPTTVTGQTNQEGDTDGTSF